MLLIWLTELWSLNRAFLKIQRVSELKLKAAQEPVFQQPRLCSVLSRQSCCFHVSWKCYSSCILEDSSWRLGKFKRQTKQFPLMSPSLAPSIFLNDLRTFCWCSAFVLKRFLSTSLQLMTFTLFPQKITFDSSSVLHLHSPRLYPRLFSKPCEQY